MSSGDNRCIEHKIRQETLTTGFLEQKELLTTMSGDLAKLASYQVGNEAKVMQMLVAMQGHCDKVTKCLDGNGDPGLIRDNATLKEQARNQKDKVDSLAANLKWVAALVLTTILGVLAEHFLK